jgi:hypothetical protein
MYGALPGSVRGSASISARHAIVLGDDLRRAAFLEGQLGMAMQVPAQRHHRRAAPLGLFGEREVGLTHVASGGIPMRMCAPQPYCSVIA